MPDAINPIQQVKKKNRISRLLRANVIPFSPELEKTYGKGFYYKGKAFVHHSSLHHEDSAFHRLSGIQIVLFVLLIAASVMGLLINWHTTIVVLVAIITSLYFSDLLFNLYLIFRSFSKGTEIHIAPEEIGATPPLKLYQNRSMAELHHFLSII